MKFIDLFAGIGGFRFGMESAGHECVAFCEINKFARASYKAIHNTEGEIELHDITTVTDDEIRNIGHVDAICGGFPCQAFSIAGHRRGFEDTRGTLFFEIARFAAILKPKYLFLENVKGLLNHDKGDTFETILSALDELGYDVEWQVLNSKGFGVPQNRERVFIIGHLRGQRGRKIFPIGGKDEKSSAERLGINILGNTKNPNGTAQGTRDIVHDPEGIVGTLTATDYKGPKQVAIPNEIKKYGVLQPNFNQSGVVYETDDISPTIRTMQGGGLEPKIIQRSHGYNNGGEHCIAPTLTSNSYHENNFLKLKIREATKQGYAEASAGDSVNLSHPNSKTRRGRVGEGIANTLVTGDNQGVVTSNFRIRKLTPREYWRLQGFPDWAFDKAQEVNSNSQLYKQAGNSVTVNVIKEIARYL
ncbi:DNA cytosine methyltransferase [Streptococcus salivarius]|uniref:DNA cytosine methyltransferase n=1 Tax=Streptococcus salivarius TaxID=1304 RepID=UPI003219B805